ncbi:BlaI/MecI/CopY family transcriptional regulator [Mariniblastus fucicola]|uniref:Methicillin resistance regulatory protein MecI n=1 Tax=Mariniblastus fucicola TaxID=980251 RepID=A0A5B9P1Q9_9BACT|nr:BlaI/MecI/CopY family transcriptional regulator [Mariniblastus fucicola]QEG20248.1 Methicillin resistance regulatory protein MecI [Mariniblastus fucicola]
MGKKQNKSTQMKPTDGEQEILSALWALEKATVRQVYTELSGKRDVGYTTVLKLMQIMFEKGLLDRDETSRSHMYWPRQKAQVTQRRLVNDFVQKVFGGSTGKLVLNALSTKKATPAEIADIRKMLDEMGADE